MRLDGVAVTTIDSRTHIGVLHMRARLSHEYHARLQETWKAYLPDVRLLILTDGAQLEFIQDTSRAADTLDEPLRLPSTSDSYEPHPVLL